jgi:hypothetical protein
VPQRFIHKRINAAEFKAELQRQDISLRSFTRIWCQNLTTTTRWANGQNDVPTWVPIALTLMTLPGALGTARTAAAAMIEADTLRPELGPFPYQRARELPSDDDAED